MGERLSDPGWRRGDIAAWWDATARCWQRGTLVARVTVPTFEYDLTTPSGSVVRVPARLLRSLQDPAVDPAVDPAAGPVADIVEARAPQRMPPRRPGATLRERSKGSPG